MDEKNKTGKIRQKRCEDRDEIRSLKKHDRAFAFYVPRNKDQSGKEQRVEQKEIDLEFADTINKGAQYKMNQYGNVLSMVIQKKERKTDKKVNRVKHFFPCFRNRSRTQ
ncbi:MAG: hypothetical protein ABH859_02470 [Pseudomonadota bacterium]